jgi:peptidoglycan hydrolase-like protein with peptidoglycan-binding domain
VRDTMRNDRGPATRREPDFDDLFKVAKRRRKSRRGGLVQRIGGRRIADILAASVAVAAMLLVFVNALGMQRAPHQAPVPAHTSTETNVKRAVPAPAATTAPIPPVRPDNGNRRTRSDIMLDVQRELASRGYYDGAVDGQSGPRVSQAIRGFEQTNGLKATGEPSDALLEKIRKAAAKSDITGSVEPAAKVATGSRIFSVQRMLARYGYGPLRLNGEMDKDTRAAVERFERDRNLQATGEISDKLVRELAAFSGASFD